MLSKYTWIYLNNERTKYVINPYGDILNIETNHPLKWKKDSKGYASVTLSHKGVTYDKRVHVLVATYFIKNPNPEKFTIVNHLDGNKMNPTYTNLEWTDYSGNVKHAIRTGLLVPAWGENNGKAVLTNDQVHKICKLMEDGKMTQREISNEFGVDESVIHEIRLGHNWTNISKDYKIENCKLAVYTLSDDVIHNICKDIVDNELSISKIAEKNNVSYDAVLGILNHRSYLDITRNYDFSVYSKRTRYTDELRNSILDLMNKGLSNTEIVNQLDLPRGSKTNTMLYRFRQKLK